MATEAVFESCLPILKDESLDEEDKTEKIEDIVKQESRLSGKQLEMTVLDILWRHRNSSDPTHASPNTRQTFVRRNSKPAAWQISRGNTPVGGSPRSAAASPAPPASQSIRPNLLRLKSNQSTYSIPSPLQSPRVPYSGLHIPHSPSLNAYEFSEDASTPDVYGDLGRDNVDWLVSDDGTTPGDSSGNEWFSPQNLDMSPYDMVRSVIRDEKSDEEIEKLLESNGYDLSAAIASLMDASASDLQNNSYVENDKTILVGKSMAPSSRPTTPVGQGKSPIVCRYWLSTGQCLRADCRFSHDLSNHICKFWLAGNCLAGDSCMFSHDPSLLMSGFGLQGPNFAMTPPNDPSFSNYRMNDPSVFPALSSASPSMAMPGLKPPFKAPEGSQDGIVPPPGLSTLPVLAPEFVPSRPQSRPSSRHQSPGPKSPGLLSDNGDSFPSLSAATRTPRKHHGKRGHGHSHREKENIPSSLADVVSMAPGASPTQVARRTLRGRGSYGGVRENSLAAQSIPAPERIPWLETGERANKAYLKARQEAIRHGGARNKFLQSAAQAWNRNDVRAAKALSLRGQSENDLMREAHREAARALFEDRNKHRSARADDEVYVDLHGLHPAEAVSYLANALAHQRSATALHRDLSPYIYAIVGTGHHSKSGRDKVGKAVRSYLNECRYAFKEFSVPGDRGGNGGILGVDANSGDSTAPGGTKAEAEAAEEPSSPPPFSTAKIQILKADDAKGLEL